MGKRKHRENEEYFARKIRKLERKMWKVRRRRERHSSNSSDNTNSQGTPRSEGAYINDNVVVVNNELKETFAIEDPITSPAATASAPAPTHAPAPCASDPALALPTLCARDPALASVLAAASSVAPEPVPLLESIIELEPDILCILGDEPAEKEFFGASIHKDIVSRWCDILINGLPEGTKKDILSKYLVPENLKLAQAPSLNPEVKAAINEGAQKRDVILSEKQRLIGSIISCVANTMSGFLAKDSKENDNDSKTDVLKALSDTGRLLCHMHFEETQARRSFVLACLNKEVKDNIINLKRDHLLFGNDLQENLKTMKAITRTGAELKHTVPKPKANPKNKQSEASTSRALNWRGPPPPPPPPRRAPAPARQSSTAGGRKQQPARRTGDKRQSRYNSRSKRR